MDSSALSGRTWDAASSPAATRLARRFESAWRGTSQSSRRPDPVDYLPTDPIQRPGALLALLRTELALRFEARERVSVEWYRQRHPELGPEALVALIYEEYCLREEAGEPLNPAEYQSRFPEFASQLRRVFDIHGLVGSNQSAAFPAKEPVVPFPEVGQTIAGFRLVEDLGRGAFARVFKAEERQLADRPVALKVARSGSREPQTLARLQHTHIVPVHSYRIDPVTGLHLLCMPFLGNVTLSQVLADPEVRSARMGTDLVAVLDRLQPAEPKAKGRPVVRQALAKRSYAQAIAWWGARMAEALQHAHDRGVLHRDIKPSNVLVTAEGEPMLLDFNLAQEFWLEGLGAEQAAVGGTLVYMAPEHLEALADGISEGIDARADIYALGVLLFEALAGSRPFAVPSNALSVGEALLRAAEERRAETPGLRDRQSDVPPALDAVVRRCLAPDPADRYASAADLAEDLRAVADDGPLRHAREPQPHRSLRWARRNRKRLALAVPVALALLAGAWTYNQAQIEQYTRKVEIEDLIGQARTAREAGDFALAIDRSRSAENEAHRHQLSDLEAKARGQRHLAQQTQQIRANADDLFVQAQPLKFCLLGFGGNLAAASKTLEAALGKFYVLANNPDWTQLAETMEPLLDQPRRERLINEVNDLLFMWLVATDRERPGDVETARRAVAICDRALVFATPQGPWEALRARFSNRLEPSRGAVPARVASNLSTETSARACFQWALLSKLEGRLDWAIAWLERATRLEENEYWYQFYLGYNHELAYYQDRSDHLEQALRHYSQAITIDPSSPWARHNRARLYRLRGAWALAFDDLKRALASERDDPELKLRARLDLGWVYQALGNTAAARAEYDQVIATESDSTFARAARHNRAKLDFDSGLVARARAEYDALLGEDPRDATARLGRALVAMRQGEAAQAESDLTQILQESPTSAAEEADLAANRVQALALRALVRLLKGQAVEAEGDAASAFQLDPSPGHQRLWSRTLLAIGRERALRLDDPAEIALWPAGGPALLQSLAAAAERLRLPSTGNKPSALQDVMTRAVLLSALGNAEAAEDEASRAIDWDSVSSHAYRIRARLRLRAGNPAGARSDVLQGLNIDPGDSGLLTLRGMLEYRAGRPSSALADFDRALRQGASAQVRGLRAQALLALGLTTQAIDDWSRAIAFDSEDPRLYLGRARSFLRAGKLDQALADLEQAAGWAGERPDLLLPIVLTYASCLPQRPAASGRVLSLARQVLKVASPR